MVWVGGCTSCDGVWVGVPHVMVQVGGCTSCNEVGGGCISYYVVWV